MTIAEVWQFINAGGLPAVLILILWSGYKKMWVYGSVCERETARADKAEADRDRATQIIQDKLIPAVIEFTHAANKVLDVKETRERPSEP